MLQQENSQIAILSDLHLSESHPVLLKNFCDLLDEFSEKDLSQLWLLGDIFDLLVGPYKFWSKQYQEIFDRLALLHKKGCHILWCEGNHDFHIQTFLKKFGIEVFDGEKILELHARKIFLAHGDLVNKQDTAYLQWRAFTRNKLFRKSLDQIPSLFAQTLLQPIAKKISHKSRHSEKRDEKEFLLNLYRQNADKLFDQGFDAVFMGHCHVEDIYKKDSKFYVNLGSALDGSLRYAMWNPPHEAFPKVLIHSKIDT